MIKKEIVTIKEVKDYLKVSKSTIYDLIKTEQLEAVKIRSCYRITRVALKAFIEKNKTF